MKEKRVRHIYYFKNYYLDFFETLSPEVKKKFNWTLRLISTIDRVPSKFLAHISGSSGIYEIRIEVGKNIYRVFCFFDQGQLIILLNAFQKKSRKTPKKELLKAQKLKKQYFDETKNT